MPLIKQYVKAFELDDRDLHAHQIFVAKSGESLLGFGRIRKHNGCDEYCTLGIIESCRGLGVAKLITQAIVKSADQPLYLACIIPNYFENQGFVVTNNFPEQMQNKLDYCNDALSVAEKYVVMKYKNETIF